MSTLEHPDGETAPSVPPTPAEPDPDPEDGADAGRPESQTATEAGAEPQTEGSSLERPASVDPLDAEEIRVDRSAVRHAPRFGRFATVGGLLGIVLAFLLSPFARYENLGVPWHFDPWGLALLLAAILLPVGVLAGCIVALIADRRSRRRR